MIPTTTLELVADRQGRYLDEAAQHRLARSHSTARRAVATRLSTRIAARIDTIATWRPVHAQVAPTPAACTC